MRATVRTIQITTKQPELEIAFSKKAFGGYDPKEVDETVDKLIVQLRELEMKNRDQSDKLAGYRKQLGEAANYLKCVDEARKTERLQIAEVMTVARTDAAKVMEQTHEEVDKLAKRAWEETAYILFAAQKTAGLAVADAEREAQAILDAARREAEAVRVETHTLLRQFSGFAHSAKQVLQSLETQTTTMYGLCPELSESGAFSWKKPASPDDGAQEVQTNEVVLCGAVCDAFENGSDGP
jgi:DivIVA domain-containing protein